MNVDPTLLHNPLRLGTRGSELALWQANYVKDLLVRRWGKDLTIELHIIATEGDRIQDRQLHEVGGKGLFVKAIEEKLLEGAVDLAVHSMKDLPAFSPPGLKIACTPPREDPRDALVMGAAHTTALLSKLPKGTRIGTGSLRRGALLRRINPGLELVPMRGNVPTRLRKVDDGEVEGIVLAAAGLRRLGLHERVTEYLEAERFCPSPAQGILALQCRDRDARVQELLRPLQDAATAICSLAERSFLRRLGASCTTPVGCFAELRADDVLTVSGVVVDPCGRPCFMSSKTAHPREAEALGIRLADNLLALGAHRIVGVGELQVA